MNKLSDDTRNKRTAAILKALAHPVRVDVIRLVSEREMTVNEIVAAVGASQSSLSQHLAVLRGADLVTTRRASQTVHYSIASDEIHDFLDLVDKFAALGANEKR